MCQNYLPLKGWTMFCCMYTPRVFIHSSVRGHLGGFRLRAVVGNAAVSTGVQMSILAPAFNSFAYGPRSGIAGSDGKSMSNFFFSRNYCSDLIVSILSLSPHQMSREGPHSPAQQTVWPGGITQ